MAKNGLLLINLGTPRSLAPRDVGRFLDELLMDKYVIDLPWILRAILVKLLIVPRRKHSSARLYEHVWTASGSPIMVFSNKLSAALAKRLGPDWQIEFGMRYQVPGIAQALASLQQSGIQHLTILPLYPQNAKGTVLTSVEACQKWLEEYWPAVPVRFIPPFFDHPAFIQAQAQAIRPQLKANRHLLLSFHGLPERHLLKAKKPGSCCLAAKNCCDDFLDPDCYRAQCIRTAKLIANELGLGSTGYSVSFQSRLGASPWTSPYTADVLRGLPSQGHKDLVVACPSFVADCLETLEEIAIGGAAIFKDHGGHEFTIVPCLNDHPMWIEAIAQMLQAVQ
jgi:protoporphyrin/coproporphyrin ferrochelatase